MFGWNISYATPSAFESGKGRALLGLSVDEGRRIRFKGKIKPGSVFLVRTAMRALAEVLWSNDYWNWDGFFNTLDPVFTVHPDKLFLEAFSQDQTAHVCLGLNRDLFETEGEVLCGSSNVDFTSWLWSALGEMRTSRATWLHIDSKGLELQTVGAGGRFEKKVEVPESWVRGFLEIQAAASMPGTRVRMKPVDLLSVIRFLRYSKPKTSPRALRYEFEPGQPVRIVVEPWEESFILRDSEHDFEKNKVVRLWGRKRLALLEPLLPFAEEVEVFLKGRALPSFYALKLPGIEFHLGISGHGYSRWSEGEGFHLLGSAEKPEPEKLEQAEQLLSESFHLSSKELSRQAGVDKGAAEASLAELCRIGKAFYLPHEQSYRARSLFRKPPELERIFPPSMKVEQAAALVREGKVEVRSCEPRETRKIKRLASPSGPVVKEIVYRDWCLEGKVGDQDQVEVVLNDVDRIIFARCGCEHFREHLLNQGPCEHMLALRSAGEELRRDLPTSHSVTEEEGE